MKQPLMIFWGVFLWLLTGRLPVFAVSCVGTTFSDSTYTVSIHESLPPFLIRHIKKETTEKYSRWCYELHIIEQDTAVQTIYGESSDVFGGMSIEFLDVNFDGYSDMKILNARAANGVNEGFAIYLYHREDTAFAYNEAFSDIFAGTSARLKPENKEITTHGELGCMGECWSTDTYRVEEDSLILIRRIFRNQDKDTHGVYVVVKEELIDGKLTVISKKKEKSQFDEH